MKYILIVLLAPLALGHGYKEWLTGFDMTLNEQAQLSVSANYPINIYKDISFPKRFSRIPHVLLLIEEIKWAKNKEIDFYVYPSDITIRGLNFSDLTRLGFKLNYHVAGPGFITKMKVKWVAILDHSVEIQYVHYTFSDLIRLRQGQGRRSDSFVINYSQTHYPTPKVVAFIVGTKIDVSDAQAYNLELKVGRPATRSVDIEFKTRDHCHVKKLEVALLISGSADVITAFGGAAANEYNKFSDKTNNVARRMERFEKDVPVGLTLETHKNVLAQGISGFDVNSKAGDVYMKVGQEYIRDNKYIMSFGTQGETVMYSLWYSIVLHKPAQPPN